MIKSLLEDAGLTPEVCASLLGVNPTKFKRWVSGEADMPGFIVPELASVLGVSQDELRLGLAVPAPAIWYKFRGERLVDADRELVVLIRRLGFYMHQLTSVTGQSQDKWSTHFGHIRHKLEQHKLASPDLQGSIAANLFRSGVDLGMPRLALDNRISGAGDIIRGILRSLGVLVIEMPIPDSQMDGCSFYVGDVGQETPCLFINTYRQGWFRRNYVLAHELAHAIFDIDGEAALIDYRGNSREMSVKEARADAFARNCFSNEATLRALTSQLGLHWNDLGVRDLARLVAYAQVELKTILKSACDAGLITVEQASIYSRKSLRKELRAVSERVLTPKEYFKIYPERALWSEEFRTTTIPSRDLRLPVPYITGVLNAVNANLISDGKAAEMLMMNYEVFIRRFGELVEDLAA